MRSYRQSWLLGAVLFSSCGIFEGEKRTVYQPAPIPYTIKSDVDKHCTPCHRPGGQMPAVVFDTAEKYLASKARARVSAGTMPPAAAPLQLPADAKARLIAFSGATR